MCTCENQLLPHDPIPDVCPEPKPTLPMDPDPDAVEVAPGTFLHWGLYLRGAR